MKQIIQEYNQLFFNFIRSYDLNNTNIVRKIAHSFSVADKCYQLACRFNLKDEDRNFSYLIGLLHDLGRFEQWKLFSTYDDLSSIDHGNLSSEIIKKMDAKRLFISEQKKQILMQVVKYHTKGYKGKDKDINFYIAMRFHPETLYKIRKQHNEIFKFFIEECKK